MPPKVTSLRSARSALTRRLRSAEQSFYEIQRRNITTFRQQPLAEISGSFGDFGSLLPLLIALTTTGSISLSSTLVFSGLANIITGVVFGIPLPVQPMKAIAAVAIGEKFGPDVTASAGLFVAGAIGLLTVTGTLQWATNHVPVPVVKGIQVGTGISLAASAGTLYHANAANNAVLGLAFIGLLLSGRYQKVPYALLVILIGVLWIVIRQFEYYQPAHRHWPSLSLWKPGIFVPSTDSFSKGMLEAGLGQLPLTALNSIIAVTFLAEDLLPDMKPPSTTALGFSVALFNLVGCWFRAMPICHGSGGLAAQYRFGARSGSSVTFLGLIKLLLGIFAADVGLWVFEHLPNVFLCILVIAAGLELAKVGESLNTEEARDLAQRRKLDQDLTGEERKRRWMIMLMTIAGIMAFHNTAIGFLAGLLCHWCYVITDMLESRMQQGRIHLHDGAAQ